MQKLIYRNPNGEEIDFTSGDFGVTKWSGFSKVDMDVQSQQVPFHDGSVFLDALLGERELSVTVAVNDDNNLEKRYRLKREMIHCLNPKLGEGELIYTNDYTSKKIVCVPDIPEFDNKNMNDSGTMKAMCSFTASNPYWEDVEETLVAFSDDHIQVVENEGDIKVPVKLNVVSNGLENFSIKNVSDGEKLEFLGNVSTGFLKISSEVGKKICETQKISTELSCGIKFYNAVELNKKIYFFSGAYILKSSDGIKIDEQFRGEYSINACCTDEENDRIICATSDSGYFKFGFYSENNEWTDFNFSATIGNIYSIAIGDGIICAVGYKTDPSLQYFILTSSDNGETWVYTNTAEQWNVCKYFTGVGFVLGGFNGEIKVSLDGSSWESKTYLSRMISDIAEFDGEMFVVANGIYKSSDSMTTWESLFNGQNFTGKIAISKIFGLMISQGNSIYKSKDYITLDRIDLSYTLNTIIWISFLSEFIGAGDAILYSMGSNDFYVLWEPCFPNSMYYVNGICYNNKDAVAVGYNYTAIKNKNNKWQYQNANKNFNKVIFISDYNGYFAVATDGIYFSTDGLNWVQKLNNGNITDIGYLEKSKIIVATAKTYIDVLGDTYNYGVVWESGNGINWTPLIFSNPLLGLSILDSKEELKDDNWWNAIAVGQNGQVVVRGTLSNTWQEKNLGSGRTMNCACRYGDYIFTFGNNGYYAMITDKRTVLASWSEGRAEAKNLKDNQISTITSVLYRIKYIPSLGLFFMVGAKFIFYSFDCINWIILEFLGDSIILNDFIYNEYLEEFIFVGNASSLPLLEEGKFVTVQNEINKLSEDSNLDLGLDIGTNKFQITKQDGSGKILIRFSKKYLGV